MGHCDKTHLLTPHLTFFTSFGFTSGCSTFHDWAFELPEELLVCSEDTRIDKIDLHHVSVRSGVQCNGHLPSTSIRSGRSERVYRTRLHIQLSLTRQEARLAHLFVSKFAIRRMPWSFCSLATSGDDPHHRRLDRLEVDRTPAFSCLSAIAASRQSLHYCAELSGQPDHTRRVFIALTRSYPMIRTCRLLLLH